MRPSTVWNQRWVWAERLRGSGRGFTERSGKWLIFVSIEHLDEAWGLVQAATEDGYLGPLSKAATALPSEFGTSSTKVICVYTYDFEDKADVIRVREELRARCRVTRASYKTDQDTIDGIYGRGTSKYWG